MTGTNERYVFEKGICNNLIIFARVTCMIRCAGLVLFQSSICGSFEAKHLSEIFAKDVQLNTDKVSLILDTMH